MAGAIPKEIMSEIESKNPPNTLTVLVKFATAPSKKSQIAENIIQYVDFYRLVN